MRVIGGEFRSRRLKPVPGFDTRPTPDRLRETLFNILAPRIEGAVFLDAYAGTGAVGIEALSRGAARVVFIESNRTAAAVIRDNLAALGIQNRTEVFTGKAHQSLERLSREADIVFLDPPYSLEREYTDALSILGGTAPALVIVQHNARFALPDESERLHRYRTVRQGDNALSFYEQR
jgi:16S rRNA (guanine(966)-N(2))-methyltransferase RsmD